MTTHATGTPPQLAHSKPIRLIRSPVFHRQTWPRIQTCEGGSLRALAQLRNTDSLVAGEARSVRTPVRTPILQFVRTFYDTENFV